jgi:hypothetical protein
MAIYAQKRKGRGIDDVCRREAVRLADDENGEERAQQRGEQARPQSRNATSDQHRASKRCGDSSPKIGASKSRAARTGNDSDGNAVQQRDLTGRELRLGQA